MRKIYETDYERHLKEVVGLDKAQMLFLYVLSTGALMLAYRTKETSFTLAWVIGAMGFIILCCTLFFSWVRYTHTKDI